MALSAELTDRLNAIAGGSSPTSTCAGFSCRRRLRASPIRTWTLRISRPSSPPFLQAQGEHGRDEDPEHEVEGDHIVEVLGKPVAAQRLPQ